MSVWKVERNANTAIYFLHDIAVSVYYYKNTKIASKLMIS